MHYLINSQVVVVLLLVMTVSCQLFVWPYTSLTSRKRARRVACCCLCKFVCCKGVRSLINSRPRLVSSDCLQTNRSVCVKQIFVQRLRAVWQAWSNGDALRDHSHTLDNSPSERCRSHCHSHTHPLKHVQTHTTEVFFIVRLYATV